MKKIYFIALTLICCSLFISTQVIAAGSFMEWSSAQSGSGEGITATVYSKITKGKLAFTTITVDNYDYIESFDSTFSNLHYSCSDSNSSADIFSVINFSSPLPEGSKIIAIDVDYYQETLSFTSGGFPLNLVDQIETSAGAVSVFPTYDSLSGQLQATPDIENDNQKEASIFDASGLTSVQITFERGKGSGILIAIWIDSSAVQQTFTQADIDNAIEEARMSGLEEGFQAGLEECSSLLSQSNTDIDIEEIPVSEFRIKAFNIHTDSGKFNLNCDLTYENSDKNEYVDVELALNGEVVFASNCTLKSAETIIGNFSSTPEEGLVEYYLNSTLIGSFFIEYKNGNNELHLVK
ncbi:exported hypothetical protein [Desulfamplus magnetovallimortis]|uniref:Uncharacterized protein n=1 Tax=Desulfamplus magnetovallimortis TaxID=1246637 RepID=A0A1W1HER9_9BACT|nr:hypothetical protein [Desulfamplus magnetovallimortis]SLM30994.1 exported hypothetical protein [Desulfamplus magnetovallimortis]